MSLTLELPQTPIAAMLAGRRKATVERERKERLEVEAESRRVRRHNRDPRVKLYRREKEKASKRAAPIMALCRELLALAEAEWLVGRSAQQARSARGIAKRKAGACPSVSGMPERSEG